MRDSFTARAFGLGTQARRKCKIRSTDKDEKFQKLLSEVPQERKAELESAWHRGWGTQDIFGYMYDAQPERE